MANRLKTATADATAVLDTASSEREHVFDLFRRWGYLQADLDPLGFLQALKVPELQIESEFAREARQAYCGTIGVEFMHIPDSEKRRWIQERMEGPQSPVDQEAALDQLIRAELFELVLQ